MSHPHAINNQRIEELSNMGINHFKIAARFTMPNLFFWIITYYLVLPEYRTKVYNKLLINL